MKGLICEIYRSADFKDPLSIYRDKKKVTLIDANGILVPKIFEPSQDAPPVMLIERRIGTRPYLTAYPATIDGAPLPFCEPWVVMASGSFIFTSDSRFPNDYPIPLHDRKE